MGVVKPDGISAFSVSNLFKKRIWCFGKRRLASWSEKFGGPMPREQYTYEDVITKALAVTTEHLASDGHTTLHDKVLTEDFQDSLHDALGDIEKLKELSVI